MDPQHELPNDVKIEDVPPNPLTPSIVEEYPLNTAPRGEVMALYDEWHGKRVRLNTGPGRQFHGETGTVIGADRNRYDEPARLVINLDNPTPLIQRVLARPDQVIEL